MARVRPRLGSRVPSITHPPYRRLDRMAASLPVVVLALALVAAGLPGGVVASGPTLAVTPDAVSPGATVTVEGAGFGDHQHGDLSIDGSTAGLPDFRSDASGSFSVTISIPTSTATGTHTVTAETSNGHSQASAAIMVGLATASATPTPEPTTSPSVSPTPTPTATPTSSPVATATPTPTATATPTPTPTASSSPGALPSFSHVYVIVMENQEYGSIIGNSAAPYINALAGQYGLATNYDAVAHPSEPNYLALWSGSTQGVTDDGTYDLSGTNLADQLAAKGRTWKVFAQNVPLGCYTGTTASGGEDGPGTYVRRHNPAISFTDISGNASRCANITDFSHFDPAAADLELIVPNTCNDMHDCSIATGDAWLSSFVPRITSSPAFANSAIFITWDEGTTSTGGGGHVATLVVSPLTKPGTRSATFHDHYSLLRTVENTWGLGCLGQTCAANDMREFFAP